MKKPIVGISGSELTKNVGPFVGYRRSYVNKDYSEAVIKKWRCSDDYSVQ